MKKILFLFVVMLGTLGAYAQSNTTPIKGDVNNDGVVDVADINAIIEIMKNGGGTTVDNSAYFFYVGLEMPTSTSNPAANLVGEEEIGWHLIGTSLDGINKSAPAHSSAHPIILDPTYESEDGVDFYIVIPQELNVYDDLGNILNGIYTDMGTAEIGGHTYKIFKAHDFEFIFNIYKKDVDNSAYFFYVGLEMPTSASNPGANLVGTGEPGWHLIGSSIDNIGVSNKALDTSDQANCIIVEPTYQTADGVDFYIVIPQELNIYDGLGNNLNGNYTDMGTIEIGGHTYKIFKAHDYEFIFNIY